MRQNPVMDTEPPSTRVQGPPADGSAGQDGWRARVRRTPAGALGLKVAVLALGLLFVVLGLALAALPGPLTIPPILLGVWIWSSEFDWADRLLERAKASAREAWEKTKRRPLLSALITVAGLVGLVVGLYLVNRYELIARGQDLVGL